MTLARPAPKGAGLSRQMRSGVTDLELRPHGYRKVRSRILDVVWGTDIGRCACGVGCVERWFRSLLVRAAAAPLAVLCLVQSKEQRCAASLEGTSYS